jgi:hypothetical protein
LHPAIHPFPSHAHPAEMAELEMGKQIAILVCNDGIHCDVQGNEIDYFDRKLQATAGILDRDYVHDACHEYRRALAGRYD